MAAWADGPGPLVVLMLAFAVGSWRQEGTRESPNSRRTDRNSWFCPRVWALGIRSHGWCGARWRYGGRRRGPGRRSAPDIGESSGVPEEFWVGHYSRLLLEGNLGESIEHLPGLAALETLEFLGDGQVQLRFEYYSEDAPPRTYVLERLRLDVWALVPTSGDQAFRGSTPVDRIEVELGARCDELQIRYLHPGGEETTSTLGRGELCWDPKCEPLSGAGNEDRVTSRVDYCDAPPEPCG